MNDPLKRMNKQAIYWENIFTNHISKKGLACSLYTQTIQLGKCNIVIYKKYIFGHSDDQNIFLIYIWSLSMVAGLQLPKCLEFPEW